MSNFLYRLRFVYDSSYLFVLSVAYLFNPKTFCVLQDEVKNYYYNITNDNDSESVQSSSEGACTMAEESVHSPEGVQSTEEVGEEQSFVRPKYESYDE
jgi:hypothetical protein